jgi:tRNA (cmo5U34)-methyltransferase
MLKSIREAADDSSVKIIEHDLSNSLPYDESFGGRSFDMLYQASIHHLTHERKRSLYSEIFPILNPNGIFCNLDHVSSPTYRLHERFTAKLGKTPETEDRSNRLLDVKSHLDGFRKLDLLMWRTAIGSGLNLLF